MMTTTVETVSLVGLTPVKAAQFVASCVEKFGAVRVDDFGRYGSWNQVARLRARLDRFGIDIKVSEVGWLAARR